MKSLAISIMFVVSYNLAFSQNENNTKQWIYVADGSDSKIYVYSEMVGTDDIEGGIKVWLKYKFKNKKVGRKQYPNCEMKQLMLIECTERKLMLKKYIFYSSSGVVIKSSEPYEESYEWDNVAPESVGEAIVKKVCELFN